MRVEHAELHVGCSGWSYADWGGRWYPDRLPDADRLGWYARRFDAVEVNSTHYGTPSPATLTAWREAVGPDFRFDVKLHRFGSHRKKLLDPEQWVPRSLEPPHGLDGVIGCLLLQLPPRWRPQWDRLDRALALLGRCGRWRRQAPPALVVEVRDPRWAGPELDDVLVRHGASRCLHDLSAGTLGPDAVDRVQHGVAYLRFHGPDPTRPYHGPYGRRRLAPFAAAVAGRLRAGIDVHAFFDNDVGAAAPRDARRFRDLILEAAA